jgi:hypothetical protein
MRAGGVVDDYAAVAVQLHARTCCQRYTQSDCCATVGVVNAEHANFAHILRPHNTHVRACAYRRRAHNSHVTSVCDK